MLLRRLLLLAGLILATPSLAQAPPPEADIRLLVDISGSMKRTDPDNLRRPALSLLVRLLPPGSEAGVWTFGEQVNALVPHGDVNEAWKDGALSQVEAINSVALFTHIGAALEGAAYDRAEREQHTEARTDIILLTDGVVDVSPDPQVSGREQQRVMRELVPALRAQGYRIHTIGLSDEADEALLRDMARAADGLYSQARSADQLMDSLLQIFQQTVPAERLPINGGLFLIDDSIEEFTALVRKAPEQEATELTAPDGRRYHAGSEYSELHWHSTPDYDLITVSEPQTGRWEINAELQPLSRLTIISNLQLVVEPLANNRHVGEPIEVSFFLQDRSGVIDDPEVLELLTLTLELLGTTDSDQAIETWRGAPPDDGRYQMTLPAPRRPGEYRLRLTLDGKSFQRLFTHRLSVASQFDVSLTKRWSQGQVHWDLRVDGKDTLNPEQTSVVAHVRHSQGHSAVQTLPAEEPGVWTYTLQPEARANYRIALQASGQTQEGRAFEEYLPTQYFTHPEPGDPEPDPLGDAIVDLQGALTEGEQAVERARSGQDSQAPAEGLALEPETATTASSAPDTPPEPPRSAAHPLVLMGSLVLANGLLLALAYFGYRAIMGTGPKVAGEVNETDDEEPGAVDNDVPPSMQRIEEDLEMAMASPSSPGASANNPAAKPAPPASEGEEPSAGSEVSGSAGGEVNGSAGGEVSRSTAEDGSPAVSEEDEEPLFPLDDDQLFDDGSDDPSRR